jgi:type II secretory pathway pseudopilin PulG
MQRKSAPGGAEAGETLVEILVTVAVIGIAFVAILGGLWTAIRVSDYHRKTTTADVILRNFAEQVKERSGTYAYRPCVGGTSPDYDPWVPPAPDSSYAATVVARRFLTGYSSGQPTWSDTCPATDLGAQELTLRVSGPNGPGTAAQVRGSESVVIVKRDARGES